MAKYEKIAEFLTQSNRDRIQISFDEIEQILGFSLPKSKIYPAWWSNNPSNNPMTNAWIAAGYMTQNVNTDSKTLTFVRQGSDPSSTRPHSNLTTLVNSPIFGCMKGTTNTSSGVDLTEPADPNWGQVYEQHVDPSLIEIESIKNNAALNVSEKIRALGKIGLSRSDIARTLGKRYQHVRNVLVDDERKAG